MLHMYIGHTNFNTVVFVTMLKAPQVRTLEYTQIFFFFIISRALSLDKVGVQDQRLSVNSECLGKKNKTNNASFLHAKDD